MPLRLLDEHQHHGPALRTMFFLLKIFRLDASRLTQLPWNETPTPGLIVANVLDDVRELKSEAEARC